jgi:hypothetical protein
MNDQPKTEPSIWERSTLVRFFRWLFSWRGIRRILIVLAWIVTIIGLFYGEENWRGWRAWNKYREATEARGVSLDFATYIPKPAPDGQNFAATPFLNSFLLQPNDSILTNDLYARAADHVTETNKVKDKGRRRFTDLVAWQLAATALQNGELKRGQEFETDITDLAAREAAAPAILEGMKTDQAEFTELRAASTREFSRYPVKYDLENPWIILLPHLAKVKGVCQRLNLEACADLAASQNGQALADVKLILALGDSIRSEPFLISILVRMACVQIATQPVWEGLAEQRWTDAQLQELQARFLSYDFLAELQQPLKAERACGILAVDLVKKEGIGRFIPSGWLCQEKLNYDTLLDVEMEGVMDLGAKTISPSKVAANAKEVTRQLSGGREGPSLKAILHHRWMAAMLLPALTNVSVKIAMAQTATEQAALACALERYRLAHGQFPDQLEALTPPYMTRLPNDVITGQPYKYRRTDDGQFILYSVGWNEKDDGGVPGKTLFDPTQGDWVWTYPAK